MLTLLCIAVMAQAPGGPVPTPPPPGDSEPPSGLPPQPTSTPPPAPAVVPAAEAPSPKPPPGPDAGVASPSDTGLRLRGAAEAEVLVFPSGVEGGGHDAFVGLRPVAGFAVGEEFEVELGPSFRLRVIDTPPLQRALDYSGFLRWQDWDQPSNFGQIIQVLRIAKESGPFFATVGPVHKKTLSLGHVVARYSNQQNPDYHPAAASVVAKMGPVRGEFFASDVFGARLLGGAVAWDLGGTFSNAPGAKDRFALSLDVVHDAARAGQAAIADPESSRCDPTPCGRTRVDVAPPATLLELDGSAVLVRGQALRLMVEGGFGSRVNSAANLGLVLGLAADATVAEFGLSARLELRKQAGGFRHGFFGPSYELSRFAGTGFSGVPLALEQLPDAISLHGEARVAIGESATVDAALEYFSWNRIDFDGSVSVRLLGSSVVASARLTAVAVAQVPRWAFTAAVRWRLFPSFYLVGSGGTVFVPQPDGTLLRSVTASLGIGVDFERR